MLINFFMGLKERSYNIRQTPGTSADARWQCRRLVIIYNKFFSFYFSSIICIKQYITLCLLHT